MKRNGISIFTTTTRYWKQILSPIILFLSMSTVVWNYIYVHVLIYLVTSVPKSFILCQLITPFCDGGPGVNGPLTSKSTHHSSLRLWQVLGDLAWCSGFNEVLLLSFCTLMLQSRYWEHKILLATLINPLGGTYYGSFLLPCVLIIADALESIEVRPFWAAASAIESQLETSERRV